MTLVARLFALAFLLTTTSGGVRAQTPGTLVGVVGGWLSNEPLWRPEAEVVEVGGLVLGAFVLAPTPAPWFSIRAEGTYRQRGGNVTGSVSGEAFDGAVRTDYLSISLQPRVGFGAAGAKLFVNAGPTIDRVVRSRLGPALGPILEERSDVFGVGAGAGVSWARASGFHVEVEVRLFEGLGDAYSGSFVSFRNRSLELVAGVGIPLRR